MALPNLTKSGLAVTDGAETTITAVTFCQAIYVFEQPTASGWPRSWLFRGTTPGSAQQPLVAGSSMRIPGPFYPNDIAGYIELASNGGDSSTFNVQELSA